MSEPIVSVIIPTHNRKHLLNRAVASVIHQTYSNLEIIIVDDGSTDGTGEESLGIKDPRIRFLRNETARGANYSRNLGIRASKGDLLCLLDDDDEWLPMKLERQVRKLHESPGTVGLIYCGYYTVSEDGKILAERHPAARGNVHRDLLGLCLFGALTVLVKKEHLLTAGLYDEKLRSCQDWDMWIRVSKLCEVDFVPETLAKYYVHGTQISTDLNKVIDGRLGIYKKNQSELVPFPWVESKHLEHIGALYLLNNNRSEGLKFLMKSVVSNPLRPWPYLHLVMNVFFPRMHLDFLRKQNSVNLGSCTVYS